MAVHYRARGPAQYGITDVGHEVHEGRRQTGRRIVYAGSRLKLRNVREGLVRQASLPAVPGKTRRTADRGDRGDVGIIRSPNRASILPDRSR
jgi:hypothetical protein